MGASIVAYWPGITREQIESMPGFDNDDQAWGNWMAEREEQPEVQEALRKLDAEALLTVKTDGWDDDDVAWVSPRQLRAAAVRLRDAVKAGLAESQVILESYAATANGVYAVDAELATDLDNIIAIADWAEAEGAARMTLEVNW